MNQVKVAFEHLNLEKTLEYIRGKAKTSGKPVEPFLQDALVSRVRKLLSGELEYWGEKDYLFFEHLCHFPFEGVACTYYIGELPKEVGASFEIEFRSEKRLGSNEKVVACLYSFLD